MCFFLKKSAKTFHSSRRASPRFLSSALVALDVAGEDEDVVEAQGAHDDGDDEHDHHPGGSHPEVLDEDARQIDEATRGGDLGDIVERSLPADPFGLLLLGENAHVGAVGGDVVGSPA